MFGFALYRSGGSVSSSAQAAKKYGRSRTGQFAESIRSAGKAHEQSLSRCTHFWSAAVPPVQVGCDQLQPAAAPGAAKDEHIERSLHGGAEALGSNDAWDAERPADVLLVDHGIEKANRATECPM